MLDDLLCNILTFPSDGLLTAKTSQKICQPEKWKLAVYQQSEKLKITMKSIYSIYDITVFILKDLSVHNIFFYVPRNL